MNPPHNKLTGRKYSGNPSVGIPIALEVLNDKEAHRNDILSVVCYLGYRTIDGTYSDANYIWPKILSCRETSLTISPPDGGWFRTRWEVSYLTLCIYFRLIVLKEEVPLELLKTLCNEKYTESHPPQFVNVLRGCCMLAVHHLFSGNFEEADNYLKLGIRCYRTAVEKYNIDPNRPDSIIYESGEAIEALNAILEAKYADTKLKLHQLLNKWNSKTPQESRGPFYKSLLAIHALHQKSKTLMEMK